MKKRVDLSTPNFASRHQEDNGSFQRLSLTNQPKSKVKTESYSRKESQGAEC